MHANARRILSGGKWRLCPRHVAAGLAGEGGTGGRRGLRALPGQQQQQRFLASGMDAFMEFEREMALKRRKEQPERLRPKPTGPLVPPEKPKEDECCHLDCPNCVDLVYQEKLLEYELSLLDQDQFEKPPAPEPKYNVALLSNDQGDELSDEQREWLEENDRAVFEVAANRVISAPHQTEDGAWRSVRHLEVRIRDDQQRLVSDQASNIGVYVPNELSEVNRMLKHLDVLDPDVYFVAEPLDTAREEDKQKEQHLPSPQHQGFPNRPFSRVGSIRDALTWTFDLVSTPRTGQFLRHLAAYASDDDDVAALMAPQAIEAIRAERPEKHVTVADIFDHFPSLRLSFAEFFQIAPPNAPRYYTVSSSRKFEPETVSITLGLRKSDAKPLPRCSSYLSKLTPGQDVVRASFYQSSFVFPFQDHRPLMLISAGTGMAPFRAFLQDLEHELDLDTTRRRAAYVFYGCRAPDVDLLYADELQRAQESGVLDQLHVGFSAGDGVHGDKRYVQDAVLDASELVAKHLLQDEGHIYVCGSLDMGRAVKKAIAQALAAHPELSDGAVANEEDAKRVVAQKLAEERIVTELW